MWNMWLIVAQFLIWKNQKVCYLTISLNYLCSFFICRDICLSLLIAHSVEHCDEDNSLQNAKMVSKWFKSVTKHLGFTPLTHSHVLTNGSTIKIYITNGPTSFDILNKHSNFYYGRYMSNIIDNWLTSSLAIPTSTSMTLRTNWHNEDAMPLSTNSLPIPPQDTLH